MLCGSRVLVGVVDHGVKWLPRHAEVPIAIILRHGPAAVRVDELGGRVLRELLRRAQHRRRDAEAGGEADRPLGPA